MTPSRKGDAFPAAQTNEEFAIASNFRTGSVALKGRYEECNRDDPESSGEQSSPEPWILDPSIGWDPGGGLEA